MCSSVYDQNILVANCKCMKQMLFFPKGRILSQSYPISYADLCAGLIVINKATCFPVTMSNFLDYRYNDAKSEFDVFPVSLL